MPRISVETFQRVNISLVVKQEQQQSVTVKYPRNVDLDPQLVWRGKDSKIGRTWSCMRRRCTSKRKSTRGSHRAIYCDSRHDIKVRRSA